VLPPARAAAKAQQQLREKVKKALRYPAIVLTLAVLVVLAMVILVLPEFAAIYKTFNTPLPMLTQMVMGMAAFIQSYALALFAVINALSRRLGSAAEPSLAAHADAHTRDGRAGKRPKAGTHLYRAVTHAAGRYPLLQGLESAEETVESCTGGDTPQRSGGH
jgi:protein transport protein HofC